MGTEENTRFSFEDFVLDLSATELRKGENVVPMEPQVFDLLCLLVSEHARVVTKDEIIEKVWDGRIVSESAVSSRINAVRKAVGDDGSEQRLIKTVHGRGFRFATTPERIEPGASVDPANAPSSKPSIAVLPFVAMSDDTTLGYFADGIAEDIIDGLSRFHELSVIARNSSFSFRDQMIGAAEIAERLGVKYILEGSVRQMGQRIRVSVKLIDAKEQNTIWSERYDGDLSDIFDVQDEITEKAVTSIAPQTHYAEISSAYRKDIASLTDWERVMRARWHMDRQTRDDTDMALAILANVKASSPDLALAHSTEAICRMHRMLNAWCDDTLAEISAAGEAAEQAARFDTYDATAHAVMGLASMFQWRLEECHHHLDEAIRKNPNLALAYGFRATAYGVQRKLDKTLEAYDIAIRLSPEDSSRPLWLSGRGIALYLDHEYEAVLENVERMLRIHASYGPALRQRAAALARLGRMDEARAAMDEVLTYMPGLTATKLAKMVPVEAPEDQEYWLEGMRMAGLPD